MSKEGKDDQTSLIRSANSGMASRSASLVRRGLQHLSKREPRIVSFPKDYSLGQLYVVDDGIRLWERKQWVKIGEATGDVVVQPGKKLILIIYSAKCRYEGNLNPGDLHQGFESHGQSFWPYPWNDNSYVDLSYLDVIKELTELEWLCLMNTSIGGLRFLENLTNLQSLNVSGTDICTLAPLQRLTNLRYLDLSYTEIGDIECLEGLINLEELCLSNTPVWDIGYLRNLTKLRILDLRETMYGKEDEDIVKLKQALPLCEIRCDHSGILWVPYGESDQEGAWHSSLDEDKDEDVDEIPF